jgi:hypothetical protein
MNSSQAKDALVNWITSRGDEPGPLFIRLDPGAASIERLGLPAEDVTGNPRSQCLGRGQLRD